tara:strand:+ start:875 stop:1027 length:153 start_codon:yes stop_codon:yes gene_type:complete
MEEIKENDTLEAKQQEIEFLRRIAQAQTEKIEELQKVIYKLRIELKNNTN